MSDEVADVLDDAADLLEREGWVQGRAVDAEGGRCALGAIAGVTEYRSEDFVRAAISLEYALNIGSTSAWNDALGRTKAEVLDAFRAAAKAERMAAS